MNNDRFSEIIENQIAIINSTLLQKQSEYANEDRLHNFRVAAEIQNCKMQEALGGMLCNHTVSLYDMIRSKKLYTTDKWDEKINDHIIYLPLLRAIVDEINYGEDEINDK